MKKGLILLMVLVCTYMTWGEETVVFNEVFRPDRIFVEGDKIYISEEDVIKVFSLKDSKRLYQLTKKGEGPGEFKYSPTLTFLPEYIVATGNGKLVFYQKDGKKIDEKKVPSDMRLFPVKSNYIGSRLEMDNRLKKFVRKDSLYDGDFKKIIDINATRDEDAIVIDASGKMPKQNRYMIPHGYGVITDGSNICLYDSKRGFYLEIYDFKGNKISTIEKDYPKIKVSSAYKKRKINDLKKMKGWQELKKMFNFVFPEYFPAFRRVFINNDLFYILTDTPEDKDQILVVMDLTGKILKKSTAPNLDIRYFQKGKLYYFKENEDEQWVLHIRQIL